MKTTLPAIKTLRRSAAKCIAAALATTYALQPAVAHAQSAPTTGPSSSTQAVEGNTLAINVGKSKVVTFKEAVGKIEVIADKVADFRVLGGKNVLVTGVAPGQTQLIVWSEDGRSSEVYNVTVSVDVEELKARLKDLFPGTDVKATVIGNAIALSGRVPSVPMADQMMLVAGGYSTKVVNQLVFAGGQQVALEVKFAEVSRSATNQLGVNFGFTDGASFGGNNIGQVSPLGIVSGAQPGQVMLGVQSPNPAVTLFGQGGIGGTAFSYYIQALRQNNLLRILAEPTLIASSGCEANFLAGGEFPVPVTQGGGTGGVSISVEYREFGVRLKMTPLVLGDGRIRLKVGPEVSDLDFTTAVRFNGFIIPGLTSRKVQTEIELADGQSFAIAGLLQNTDDRDARTSRRCSATFPVLGALFRSVAVPEARKRNSSSS